MMYERAITVGNLKYELKFMAICNQIEQGNPPNENMPIDYEASDGNFDWAETPQGAEFWNDVRNEKGNYLSHLNID